MTSSGSHHEGGERLQQTAQRSCGGPIPQSVQDQVGWGSEKPDVVDGILPMAEGTGLDHI